MLRVIKLIYKSVFNVYASILFLVCIPVVVLAIIINNLFIQSFSFNYAVIRYWAVVWQQLIGTKPKWVSKPIIPTTSCIIIANHQSYIDIPTLLAVFPSAVYFLAKKELSKVPIFGYIYKQITICVNRESSGSRAASQKAMINALQKQHSLIIFPEGGFIAGKKDISAFNNGAFHVSFITQKPIVMVVMHDTHRIMPSQKPYGLVAGKNRVEYVGTLYPNQFKDYTEMKHTAEQLMQAALEK